MKVIVDVDSVVADLVTAIVQIYDPKLTTIEEANKWDWFRDKGPKTIKKVEEKEVKPVLENS